MLRTIKLHKGLDIRIKGEAEKVFAPDFSTNNYAVKPTDFTGLFPKILVKEGDRVKAGTPLCYDKYNEKVLLTSPVSGEITGIVRGPKRVLEEIRIKADDKIDYEDLGKENLRNLDGEQVKEKILKSGLWAAIRKRPYHAIARPNEEPKSIFISAFNTAPLAADLDFIMKGQKEAFQTGINAIAKLTKGKVFLNLRDENDTSDTFKQCTQVEKTVFKGPHPAGNVGIQIHHLDPVNKDEPVWYVSPQHVVAIGKLFNLGIYDVSKSIALCGSEVKNRKYYKIITGACIENMVKDNVAEGNLRYISGDVLTGTKIRRNGYVSFYDDQVTVIPEGDHYEFFGWASPGFKKYSVSRSFFAWLMPNKKYRLNTNYHGGERAFVMTGEYEKVLPMDILPVHLLKAILIEDIELMEKLGIYEVAEEDFALCEYVCTSKTEVQQILRRGLDMMRKEMSE